MDATEEKGGDDDVDDNDNGENIDQIKHAHLVGEDKYTNN